MESIWSESCEIRRREALNGDIETEVAVIGGGMAGILTAYQLRRAGKRVIVLEAERIGSGQTRNTTAKITSLHGLIYNRMIKKSGEDKAGKYGMANETAIREYERIVDEENIECDFEAQSAYVYSEDEDKLKSEVESARALGLPADFVQDIPIPVPAAGAVRFKNQAQFHPLKFIKAISEKVTVFEETSVESVRGNYIYTERGTVRAGKIVFACHFPFVNFPGLYFARMHQERSYVLALQDALNFEGMYIGAEKHSYSFRQYGDILLFGGENHRTGENRQGGRYDALREKAKELFPGSREIARWSAQDCISIDEIPYIGGYAHGKPDWYVATGFKKWGMTASMAAAMIIRDEICGVENQYSEIFTPRRLSLTDVPQLIHEIACSVKGLSKQFFKIKNPGDGSITTRCPHLGCRLEWNPDEQSFDCPCHGSRFGACGDLISGPAQENIKR